ncbi:hypothetical protein BDL97_16G054200 [Sphagnum fallax]|nr:hypothetical protein BDL97_16G054200 [Sphagnum fallax]
MEDPRNEIRDVVLGLTDHPSLEGQAAVLQKYFTQDVEFYNVWLNAKGLANLICIYNMGEVFLNYVGCEFQNIAYDETNNNLSVCVCVFIRPRAFLSLHLAYLRFNVHLELEDVVKSGRTVKKIKVERDYFIRSPTLEIIPIIGKIHDSDNIRFFLGHLVAGAWMVATWIFVMMWHSLLAIFGVVFGTVMTIQE